MHNAYNGILLMDVLMHAYILEYVFDIQTYLINN